MTSLDLVEHGEPVYSKRRMLERLISNARHDRLLVETSKQVRTFVKRGQVAYENKASYEDVIKAMKGCMFLFCLTSDSLA